MTLDAARLREVAVAASCDPRTVRREVEEPGSVRGLTGQRIRATLRALGLATSPGAMDVAHGQPMAVWGPR